MEVHINLWNEDIEIARNKLSEKDKIVKGLKSNLPDEATKKKKTDKQSLLSSNQNEAMTLSLLLPPK